jgi:hypothetical protein
MSGLTSSTESHGTRRISEVGAAAFTLLVLVLTLAPAPANAYWSSGGTGTAAVATGTLAPPADVTGTASVTDVDLSWSPGLGGVVPQGYFVTRLAPATANTAATVTAACTLGPVTLLTGRSCTDIGVPNGEYTYVVTAVYASWTAASSPSEVVTVVNESPLLDVAGAYSVLAGTAVVNTGATTISADVGVSPGTAFTGLGAGSVGGAVHAGDEDAAAAQIAMASAYEQLAGLPADGDPAGPPGNGELVGDLGTRTITPGVYHSTAALALTGVLTLDARGDPDAVFVFQAGAAFNTAASSSMLLTNGARASHVFWVVAGATGTGALSLVSGNLLSQGAITLGAGTVLIGRALSRTAVTLATSTIRFHVAPPPTITITGGTTRATHDITPTISGTSSASAGSRVSVSIVDQRLLTNLKADGTWALTATNLAAGAYDLTAKVREPSGDGATTSQVLTVEVCPPPVDLGSAVTFSVLAGTGVVNTGVTHLSGDLGVSPSPTVTGFGPSESGSLAGTVHAGDLAAAAARADLTAALDEVSSRTRHTEVTGDLGGRTFHVGVHHSTAALALTGSVTLDGEQNPDAVFIFQTDAAFNTAAASSVILTNGAQPANVFWVVTGSAGTGAGSTLAGSILARGAITLGATTTLAGRALSLGTVTLAANALTEVAPIPAARRAMVAGSTEPATTPSPAPVLDGAGLEEPASAPSAAETTVPDSLEPTAGNTEPETTAP